MTHIPDEAVQAALEQIHAYDYVPDENDFSNMKDAIKSALSYLSAPCAVEVVKLEWTKPYERDNQQISTTVFGTYGVWDINGEGFLSKPENIGGVSVDGGIEAAKDAAQADFERRSLSCVATKPVDVAAVRRQAFEEALQAIKSIPTPMYVETINGHEDAYRAVEALTSSEPVQGDHSGRAALAQGGEL